MALTTNSNIAALRAQRRLATSSSELSKSFERLASGLRINRASDDAAGLAVADALRSSSRLYTTATRNINDGLSMLNIMSASVSDQVSILQRLKELAEQSANGTYSSAQRLSLDQEYRALSAEMGRIGSATRFNNLSLLLGGRGINPESFNIQAGITGDTGSMLTLEGADTGAYSGNFEIGEGGAAAGSFTSEELSAAFGNRLLAASVRDQGGTLRDVLIGFEYGSAGGASVYYTAWIFQRASDTGPEGSVTHIAEPTTATSEWVAGNNSAVEITESTGRIISGLTNVTLGFENNSVAGTLSLDLSGIIFTGIPPSSGATPQGSTTAVEGSSIESVTRALDALTVIDARMNELLVLQGRIGASQSRLQSALALSEISRENTKAAESRIRDIDVAEESSLLVAAQIRQRTATAVLAQARQAPSLALTLLVDRRESLFT